VSADHEFSAREGSLPTNLQCRDKLGAVVQTRKLRGCCAAVAVLRVLRRCPR